MAGFVIVALGTLAFFILRRPTGQSRLPTGSTRPVIALGFGHGVILAGDGSLWSWGAQELGWPVLGLGTNDAVETLHRIGTNADWTSVAAGPYHNLAVRSDGTLWAWGGNYRYHLGESTRISRDRPVRSAPGDQWKQAAVGIHSVALRQDGTLWAWGNNWAGNLGNGTTNDSVAPTQVGSSTNWVKVWANGIQNLGMQSDGTLWFWGLDMSVSPERKILVPSLVAPDTNWVDVCFGSFMSFGIKSDGTLWAWGWKAHIYTGVTNLALNVAPVRVGTNTDWKACACAGERYQALLKKDGSLWVLESFDPDVVPSDRYRPPTFKRVEISGDFVAIAAGRGPVGVALTQDGEVWTWGKAFGRQTIGEAIEQAVYRTLRRAGFGSRLAPATYSVKHPQPWQLQVSKPNGPS